jgi:hypothetical protein
VYTCIVSLLTLSCHREPVEITKGGKDYCGRAKSCFELKVPPNTTMLQAYNCERQRGPKKEVMPAEKQVRTSGVVSNVARIACT